MNDMQLLPITPHYLERLERLDVFIGEARRLLGVENLTPFGDGLMAAFDAGRTAAEFVATLPR